jgi:hypothetical protein
MKGCGDLTPFVLSHLGYACMCSDPDPLDGFTVGDLAECMVSGHEAVVDELIAVTCGVSPPIPASALACQAAIANAARQYAVTLLKLLLKCRDRLNRGVISGFPPGSCGYADDKTVEGFAKARRKMLKLIRRQCTDDDIAALDVCPIRVQTVGAAEECVIEEYERAVDTLIGIEYASPPSSGYDVPVCGDGERNTLDEECDGVDDVDCPGACGPPDGPFPCLCLDVPRQRATAHDVDLDYGTRAHDNPVPASSYVVDLYDCDPSAGDVECTVGPSCSDAPHAACTGDAECAALGQGTCRKRRTAVGPHCNLDVQVACASDAQCPGCGNFFVKQSAVPRCRSPRVASASA